MGRDFTKVRSPVSINLPCLYLGFCCRFSVWSEVNLTLDAIKFQPKLVARANITSNFTQRVNITLDDEWKLNVKILEMPDNETLILNASYVLVGYCVAASVRIDWLSLCVGIHSLQKWEIRALLLVLRNETRSQPFQEMERIFHFVIMCLCADNAV